MCPCVTVCQQFAFTVTLQQGQGDMLKLKHKGDSSIMLDLHSQLQGLQKHLSVKNIRSAANVYVKMLTPAVFLTSFIYVSLDPQPAIVFHITV